MSERLIKGDSSDLMLVHNKCISNIVQLQSGFILPSKVQWHSSINVHLINRCHFRFSISLQLTPKTDLEIMVS